MRKSMIDKAKADPAAQEMEGTTAEAKAILLMKKMGELSNEEAIVLLKDALAVSEQNAAAYEGTKTSAEKRATATAIRGTLNDLQASEAMKR